MTSSSSFRTHRVKLLLQRSSGKVHSTGIISFRCRAFAVEFNNHSLSRLNFNDQSVFQVSEFYNTISLVRVKLNNNPSCFDRHPFAGSQIEGNTCPPEIFNLQSLPYGFCRRNGDTCLLPIAGSASPSVSPYVPLPHFALSLHEGNPRIFTFIPYCMSMVVDWCFHSCQHEELKHMVCIMSAYPAFS